LIQWIAVILVLLFACEVIYNLLPNFKVHRWIWITPGSVVAILVWIGLISGFKLYLTYFDTYNRTYGSLGAVIILMFWLYLTSVALLVGGLINAVLAERAQPKQIVSTVE
jgi:membrane protein